MKTLMSRFPFGTICTHLYCAFVFNLKGVTKAAALEKQKGWPSAGAQGYQITMEIQFKSVKKSPYNIGPIVGKTANIDTRKIMLP
jgi:hypothetical protein